MERMGVALIAIAVFLLVRSALQYWRDPYESYVRPIAIAAGSFVVGIVLLLRREEAA